MSQTKLWNSLFVSYLVVDLPNYLTEIIIYNWCLRWNKQVPNCPFWRKEIAEQSKIYQELRKRYIAELTQIKSLLKKYDQNILIQKLQYDKVTTIRYLKKSTKNTFLKDLDNRSKSKSVQATAEIIIDVQADEMHCPLKFESQTFTVNPTAKINE